MLTFYMTLCYNFVSIQDINFVSIHTFYTLNTKQMKRKKMKEKKKLKCRIVKFGGSKLHNYKIWGVKIVFKPKNYNLFFGYWYNKLNSKVILK
jgi:hypothetical protein